MYIQKIVFTLLAVRYASAVAIADPNPDSLDKRQSTTWQDKCGNPAPGNFKAFNVGNCQAQLTFSRGQNVGVQWNFDAIYRDGKRVTYDPIRNFDNIAVSDPFYAIGYGNNYITNRAQSNAFTSVHEFPNVCQGGAVPVAWVFYTSSASSACTSKDYRFTTGQISAQTGTRPARTSFSGRAIDSAGNVEVTWTPVSGAASYNVLIRVPTGQYEDNSGYFVAYRGLRVQTPTTKTTLSGVARSRFPEEPRKLVVNVMNSQGVWSYTPDTMPVDVRI